MLCSPQIREGTAYRESREGVGLPIAWGIEGEHGAAMADKAIPHPHPRSAWTLSHCRIRSRTLRRHSHDSEPVASKRISLIWASLAPNESKGEASYLHVAGEFLLFFLCAGLGMVRFIIFEYVLPKIFRSIRQGMTLRYTLVFM
jgi:hypothetical protein